MTDLLLVFPPLTEARLFPYLSLPMLAASTREQGFTVDTLDANIELCIDLAKPQNFSAYLENTPAPTNTKERYRQILAQYMRDHGHKHTHAVFHNPDKSERTCTEVDVQMVTRACELLLENSILKSRLKKLSALTDVADPAGDLGFDLFKARVERRLSASVPRVVGITIAYFSQIIPALLLSRWLKQHHPEVCVVWGGPQVMLHLEGLKSVPGLDKWVDILCFAEGEPALQALLSGAQDLPNCVRLSEPQKKGSLVLNTLDRLPVPDFSGLPLTQYLNNGVHLALITCVGCSWGRCAFCSYGNRSASAKSYRQLSPGRLATICETLVARHGIQRINFVDENTNLRLIQPAIRELRRRGTSIQFSTRNRLETQLQNPEVCRELAELGLVLMSCGYETYSQRILDLLDKGVKAETYQKIIDNLHEAGVTLRFSVMGGLPQETDAERAQSLEFLKANAKKIGIDVIQMLIVEPGTKLANRPAEYGLNVDAQADLLGNDTLSYGRGRVGLSYSHSNGMTFDELLTQALQIFHQVDPEGNDRRPPPAKHAALSPLKSYALADGVRRLNEETLVDLHWQRFIRVPTTWIWNGENTFQATANENVQPLLAHGLVNAC